MARRRWPPQRRRRKSTDMCLAVPGRLVSVGDEEALMRSGRVDFGGVRRQVNLACVPDAEVGDYVLVHVGMAIGVIDPEEAKRVFDYLDEMDEMERAADGLARGTER